MSKRYRIEGSRYYITSVIFNRTKLFISPSFVIPILDSINYYRYQYAITIIGYVIMPDHIHLLAYPQKESAITDFLRDFKRFTSGRITRQVKVERKSDWIRLFVQAGTETNRAEYKVWQDSFWEQCIYTDEFLKQKLDYIHLNPVCAGIVNNAIDYPYSSARSYILNDHHLIQIDGHWS